MRQTNMEFREYWENWDLLLRYAYATGAAASFAVVLLALLLASPARSADMGAGPPAYVPPGQYPAAVVAPNPCYAEFHRYKDAQGRTLLRTGPEDVEVIRDLRYNNGASLNGRVLSVTAGPNAEVALYKGRHFRRYMYTVAPGTVGNIPLGVMDSYQIRCTAAPAYAPAPYAPPPAFK